MEVPAYPRKKAAPAGKEALPRKKAAPAGSDGKSALKRKRYDVDVAKMAAKLRNKMR